MNKNLFCNFTKIKKKHPVLNKTQKNIELNHIQQKNQPNDVQKLIASLNYFENEKIYENFKYYLQDNDMYKQVTIKKPVKTIYQTEKSETIKKQKILKCAQPEVLQNHQEQNLIKQNQSMILEKSPQKLIIRTFSSKRLQQICHDFVQKDFNRQHQIQSQKFIKEKKELNFFLQKVQRKTDESKKISHEQKALQTQYKSLQNLKVRQINSAHLKQYPQINQIETKHKTMKNIIKKIKIYNQQGGCNNLRQQLICIFSKQKNLINKISDKHLSFVQILNQDIIKQKLKNESIKPNPYLFMKQGVPQFNTQSKQF